jgi:hypothetical protein
VRLRTEIGYLYAAGDNYLDTSEVEYKYKNEYCFLPVDYEIGKHDNCIVSCKFVDDQFVFVRKRGDLEVPNNMKAIKGNISNIKKIEM